MWNSGHGKDLLRVDTRTEFDVPAVTVGPGRERRTSTFHTSVGAGAIGFGRNPEPVRGRARISPVSSSNDDGGVALRVLPGNLFVTTNGTSVQTAGGFHGADEYAEARFPDGESIPAAPFESVGRTVRAGAAIVSKGRAGETRARCGGWDANAGQREQAQIDELCTDEEIRTGIEGGSGSMVCRSRPDRPGRRCLVWGRQERR